MYIGLAKKNTYQFEIGLQGFAKKYIEKQITPLEMFV